MSRCMGVALFLALCAGIVAPVNSEASGGYDELESEHAASNYNEYASYESGEFEESVLVVYESIEDDVDGESVLIVYESIEDDVDGESIVYVSIADDISAYESSVIYESAEYVYESEEVETTENPTSAPSATPTRSPTKPGETREPSATPTQAPTYPPGIFASVPELHLLHGGDSMTITVALSFEPEGPVDVTVESLFTWLKIEESSFSLTAEAPSKTLWVRADSYTEEMGVAAIGGLFSGINMIAVSSGTSNLAGVELDVQSYRHAPAMGPITFNSIATSLIIDFDAPISRADYGSATFLCSLVFSDSDVLFGPAALCSFQTSTSCVVGLTYGATVVVDDAVSTLSMKIRAAGSDGGGFDQYISAQSGVFVSSAINVDAPADALAPSIGLNFQSRIGSCDTMFISGSASTFAGGRSETWGWSVSYAGEGSASIVISEFAVSQQSNSKEVLISSPDDVPAGTYTVTITLTDMFLAVATSEIVITKEDKILPVLSSLATYFIIDEGQSTDLTVSVRSPVCAGMETGEILISWSETSGLISDQSVLDYDSEDSWVNNNPRTLNVPAQVLKSETSETLVGTNGLRYTIYTFRMTATMAADSTQTSYLDIPVAVTPAILVAAVDGGGRTVQDAVGTTITAFNSYDPGSLTTQLTYAWSCTVLAVEGGTAENCGIDLSSGTTGSLVIAPNVLNSDAFSYAFSVIVSDANLNTRDSSAASTPVTVFVTTDPVPIFELRSALDVYNQADSITLELTMAADQGAFDFVWTTPDEPSLITSDFYSTVTSGEGETSTTVYLIIDSWALAPNEGSGYRFAVTVTNDLGFSSVGEIIFYINNPPYSGNFLVTAPNGGDVGEGYITEFKLEAFAWVDVDTPINYQFAYIQNYVPEDVANGIYDLTPIGTSSAANIKNSVLLPDGTIPVLAKVCDRKGACSFPSKLLTIDPTSDLVGASSTLSDLADSFVLEKDGSSSCGSLNSLADVNSKISRRRRLKSSNADTSAELTKLSEALTYMDMSIDSEAKLFATTLYNTVSGKALTASMFDTIEGYLNQIISEYTGLGSDILTVNQLLLTVGEMQETISLEVLDATFSADGVLATHAAHLDSINTAIAWAVALTLSPGQTGVTFSVPTSFAEYVVRLSTSTIEGFSTEYVAFPETFPVAIGSNKNDAAALQTIVYATDGNPYRHQSSTAIETMVTSVSIIKEGEVLPDTSSDLKWLTVKMPIIADSAYAGIYTGAEDKNVVVTCYPENHPWEPQTYPGLPSFAIVNGVETSLSDGQYTCPSGKVLSFACGASNTIEDPPSGIFYYEWTISQACDPVVDCLYWSENSWDQTSCDFENGLTNGGSMANGGVQCKCKWFGDYAATITDAPQIITNIITLGTASPTVSLSPSKSPTSPTMAPTTPTTAPTEPSTTELLSISFSITFNAALSAESKLTSETSISKITANALGIDKSRVSTVMTVASRRGRHLLTVSYDVAVTVFESADGADSDTVEVASQASDFSSSLTSSIASSADIKNANGGEEPTVTDVAVDLAADPPTTAVDGDSGSDDVGLIIGVVVGVLAVVGGLTLYFVDFKRSRSSKGGKDPLSSPLSGGNTADLDLMKGEEPEYMDALATQEEETDALPHASI